MDAATSMGKTHGSWQRCGYGQSNHQGISTARKRSYKRAIRRAQTQGFTWYRGQLFTADGETMNTLENGAHKKTDHAPATQLSKHLPSEQRHHRFTLLNWNTGGLSQANWDNLQLWLCKNPVDVVFLQETRWRTSNEWLSQHFVCIHSAATPSKSGGLLVLISRKLIAQQLISWHAVLPGRILWIRLHFSQRSVDLVNIYQHVWQHDRTEQREDFLQQLGDLLTKIPRRNMIYMAGDFNTSMSLISDVIGSVCSSDTQRSTQKHTDWRLLHDLLQIHGMVALNTYDPALGGTYIYQEGNSRIDYVFCRKYHVETAAKQVHYLTDFPLLPTNGPYHIPILTNLKKQWYHHVEWQSQNWTYANRQVLNQHWKLKTDEWQQKADRLQTCFDTLRQHPCQTAQEMHECINTAIPPTLSTSPSPHMFGSPGLFKQFCENTKLIKQFETCCNLTLFKIFRFWTLMTRRYIIKRTMAKHSKTARKLKVREVLQQARRAADAKDQFELYRHIRVLAPKQINKRLQLRDDAGNLLSPSESADLIAEWWQQAYAGQDIESSTHAPSWIFTTEELHRSFATFEVNKAVDMKYAPSVVWRSCARPAAEMLQSQVHLWLQHQTLPSEWSAGTIVFIPKAGKPLTHPEFLRPIALIEPTSKAVLGCLSRHLLREAWDDMCQLPQFAYLRHRGCAEALLKVRQHCTQIRDQKFHHQYGIHQRAAGLRQLPLLGGLMVCLDLTRAFDCVDRNDLLCALRHFNISADLIQLVSHIYRDTQFCFQHRGQTRSFETRRGIRQGCRSAPILWSLYIGWILHKYGMQTDFQWMTNQNSIFADDWCLYDTFDSPHDLQVLLLRVGKLITLLEAHGLIVNAKTVAILHMQGNLLRSELRKHVKRTSDGTFLCIPRANQSDFLIRLVKQHSYLGVILSYNNFELQTAVHRVRQANKLSFQLQKWLTGFEGLRLPQRIQVWMQCIFPSLIHGIFQIGLTNQILQKFDVFIMKQLRRIHRAPPHLTLLSHIAFLDKYKIKDPLAILLKRCRQTIQALPRKLAAQHPCDILHTVPYHLLLTGIETLENFILIRRSTSGSIFIDKPFQCITCQKFFLTQEALRVHQTKAHAFRSGQLRVMNLETDAENGLPTCSRCQMTFTQWSHFRHHIEWICTEELPQDNANLEHFRELQQQFHRLVQSDFAQIVNQAELRDHFSTRCVLCNKYDDTQRGLTKHYKREHPDAFAAHTTFYKTFVNVAKQLRARPDECAICQQRIGQKHACVLIRQAAILAAHHTLDMQSPPHLGMVNDEGHPVYACPQCAQTFHSEEVLQDHMVSHQTDLIRFNAIRDVNPDNSCKHCGEHLSTFHATYQHIVSNVCPVFDAQKPFHTMIAEHATLHQLVRDGNLSLLLQQPEIVKIFDLTCTLCSRTFKRKNDLQSHLLNVHAEYWKQVEPLVLQLVNHYQGSAKNCYCTPKTKQWGKHQCSVLRQFALLRQVEFPTLSNDHLIPGLSKETVNKPGPYIMDCLRRSGTLEPQQVPPDSMPVPLEPPYADFSSQEFLDDTTLAANLEHMLLKPQDTSMPLLDKVQLMISGTTEVFSCPDFEKIIHSHLWTNAPTIIHTALGCDFAAMSRVREVSYFSEHCALCNFRFDSSDTVWLHMCSHVTLLNPGASVYTLGNLLHQFLDICNQAGKQTSHIHVQAALKQQFVLRVIALHYGSRRKQDAADDRGMEASASREPASPEETFRRRNISVDSTQEKEKPGQTAHQGQRGGHLDERCSEDAGGDDSSTRRSVEDTSSGSRVHHSHGRRTGWSAAGTSSAEPAMAQRDQKRSAETCLSQAPDLHDTHQADGTTGLPKRIRTLEGVREGLSDPGEWGSTLFAVGCSEPIPDSIEGETFTTEGCNADGGRTSKAIRGSDIDPEISQPEENIPGQQSGAERSLESDAEQQNSPDGLATFDQAMLSQHLAASTYSNEASNIEEICASTTTPEVSQGSVTMLGTSAICTVPLVPHLTRVVRIMMNPNVICYINSVVIGIAWVTICSNGLGTGLWNDDGKLMETVTKPSPFPLTLSIHKAFRDIFISWGNHCSISQQQDAKEFLDFLLGMLQPKFWSGGTCPAWAVSDFTVESFQEKGSRWMPLSLQAPANHDTTLQALIETWFDSAGFQFALQFRGKATAIHLNRFSDETCRIKTYSLIQMPADLCVKLPHHIVTRMDTKDVANVQWYDYDIRGLTWHQGESAYTGHYRTLLKTEEGWKHYDDNVPPAKEPVLQDFILKRCNLIWLTRKPSA